MNDEIQATLDGITKRFQTWMSGILPRMMAARTPEAMAVVERGFRSGILEQQRLAYQDALQQAVNADEGGRLCPHCRSRRRGKGRETRKAVTSAGEVCVEGVYWMCPGCGVNEHGADRLLGDELLTTPMRELTCLLGVTQGSFADASAVCRKMLGVRLSGTTIAAKTEEEGRRVLAGMPVGASVTRPVSGPLVGSCDGLMIQTREEGWKQTWSYRFDDDKSLRISGAALEPAEQFFPRLRAAALRNQADLIKQFHFVSDAATAIKDGVAQFLPEVTEHVIDIMHAYQHVHEAAGLIHGQGTPAAEAWARRWRDELYLRGGHEVWRRLSRARFKVDQRQQALEALLGYLRRNDRYMDYPRYLKENIPISSGPMESTCKQLGLRMKGRGMRWSKQNVTPMGTMICLWNDRRWDDYWKVPA